MFFSGKEVLEKNSSNPLSGLKYFIFGPEYTFPVNCFTELANFSRVVEEMARGHAMIAATEDVLWSARRVPAEVAIVLPRSAEPWDSFTTDLANLTSGRRAGIESLGGMLSLAPAYKAECYGLYLALAIDGGIPVDFLDETALLEPTVLSRFKVIFLTGPNVPTAGMAGLLAWAAEGGVLATVSSAGGRDEYDEPSQALVRATGLAPVSRDRWYLRGEQVCLPPAGGPAPCQTFAGAAALPGVGRVPFRAYGLRDRAERPPAGAAAGAKFADGVPAQIVAPVGNGSALHFPWLPGVSYAYSRQSNATTETAGLRSLLANVAHQSGVRPPATVSEQQVEAMLLLTNRSDATGGGPGAVVGLVNWRCVSDDCGPTDGAVSALRIHARLPFAPRSAFSAANGEPLEFRTGKACRGEAASQWAAPGEGGHVVCATLALAHADLVVFRA